MKEKKIPIKKILDGWVYKKYKERILNNESFELERIWETKRFI